MREIRIDLATQIDLPDPAGDDVSGRWVSSADGIAYRSKDILSGVAATYTAQRAETAVRFRRLGRPHVGDCPNLYLPHSRWRVDFRFGMMASAEKARRAIGNSSPRYTAEFKQKAMELYAKSGTMYAKVARGLGCDAGSLADWDKKAGAAGPASDANPFQMAGPAQAEVCGVLRTCSAEAPLMFGSFRSRHLRNRVIRAAAFA